jgi:hypothetical protein
LFLVMNEDRVIGAVAKRPYASEPCWVPFSLGTEHTFTELAPVKSRHAAEKAIRASWGVKP